MERGIKLTLWKWHVGRKRMTALSHPSYTQIEHVQKHPRDANVEGVGSKGAELMQCMGFELLESMSMLRCVFVSFILGTHPLFPSISVCSWFSSLFQDTRTWKSQWMMPGLWHGNPFSQDWGQQVLFCYYVLGVGTVWGLPFSVTSWPAGALDFAIPVFNMNFFKFSILTNGYHDGISNHMCLHVFSCISYIHFFFSWPSQLNEIH